MFLFKLSLKWNKVAFNDGIRITFIIINSTPCHYNTQYVVNRSFERRIISSSFRANSTQNMIVLMIEHCVVQSFAQSHERWIIEWANASFRFVLCQNKWNKQSKNSFDWNQHLLYWWDFTKKRFCWWNCSSIYQKTKEYSKTHWMLQIPPLRGGFEINFFDLR